MKLLPYRIIATIFLTAAINNQVKADVYKYVKSNGRVYYTDCPYERLDYKVINPTDPEGRLKLAESGNAEAQFSVGCSLARHDDKKALSWFKKAAEQGYIPAEYRLGKMYLDGNGVIQDFKQGYDWLLKAAEQGYAEAQFELGGMYNVGKGVPKDSAKAAIWFQKSAEQGNAEAQLLIGLMYRHGDGVPKNYVKAAIWFQKLAEQGDAFAQVLLGLMYKHGEGVPKDSAKAAIWLQKSAEQGDDTAQVSLGDLYKDGEGVPKNYVKAVELYKKAAIHGNVDAQYALGKMYLEGGGVNRDAILGYAWCNIAAASSSIAYADSSSSANRCRTNAEKQLAQSEVLEGQQLSLSWKNGQDLNRTLNADKTESNTLSTPSKQLTATALIVNPDGFALTNHHAVERCLEIQSNNGSKAKIVASDSINDIAILQFSEKYAAFAKFTSKPERLRQGEDIFVFGFPLDYLLSSGGNFTPGTVSALSGLGNNTNQIQITAPIQPGSSGSPVLDKQGNVVAMVVMKLDDIKMAKATGQVGQNVNFAVNGQTIKTFLDTNQVPYKTGGGLFSMEKNNADIADEAKKWTVLIECWK